MARTDWDLIQACREGDEQAWKQIISDYQRLVYSIPLNYGLNQNDAADIFQLTFMMLMQALESMHKESHLGGWLATVARRNTWHVLQRHYREDLGSDTTDEDMVVLDETEEITKEHWELANWLYDGLARLDKNCRALLLALYFDPKLRSYSAVAEHLGLALGSIGPLRARCLRRLKDIMLKTISH